MALAALPSGRSVSSPRRSVSNSCAGCLCSECETHRERGKQAGGLNVELRS